MEGGVLAPVETGGVFFNKEGFEDKGGEGKWDKTETPEGLKFKTHFFPAFTFCQCLWEKVKVGSSFL